MNIYTDGGYLENNPTWHEEHSAWKARHIADLLQKNAVKPDTIVEVGCGAGMILVELGGMMPLVRTFTGYEISPQAFSRCSEKASDRILYKNVDVLTSPPAQRADVVMAIDVFEHVDDYIGFIRKLDQVGRYKVFHIPLDLSVSSVARSGPLARARSEVGHIHYFSRETALATLEHAGLEILDERFTSLSIDHAVELRTRLARIPRRLIAALSPGLAARLLGGFSLLVLAE